MQAKEIKVGSFSKNVHFSVRDDFFILPSAFDVIYFS